MNPPPSPRLDIAWRRRWWRAGLLVLALVPGAVQSQVRLNEIVAEDQLQAKFEATRRASAWLEQRIEELRKQAASKANVVPISQGGRS